MTIRRGQTWGRTGPVPPGAVRAHSDGAVAEIVERARRAGEAVPPVALLGGDLMRSVGGTGDAARLAGDVALLPVDIARVTAPGAAPRWFVAHLVARRPARRGGGWRGEVVAVMNAQHRGEWDVAPRGHPNDGRVDVVRVAPSMSVRDRWRARSRIVQAAHVPHPHIDTRSTASATVTLEPGAHVWLDGRRWHVDTRTAVDIALDVEPDTLLVCV